MGQANYFAPGDWNAVCARCGNRRKASSLVKTWDGLYVCAEHWEPRHPQDFVKAVAERSVPSWGQPRPETVNVIVCSPTGVVAVADYAVADCALADFIFPGLNLETGLTE